MLFFKTSCIKLVNQAKIVCMLPCLAPRGDLLVLPTCIAMPAKTIVDAQGSDISRRRVIMIILMGQNDKRAHAEY